MTDAGILPLLQEDIRHMSVACEASHKAIAVLQQQASDEDLLEILAFGEKGTSMAIQSLHDYLADHGIEHQEGDGNALVALAEEATSVAQQDHENPGQHDLKMANAYLRLVAYAVGGYRFYAAALQALHDQKHAVPFAFGLVNLEDSARRMSAWIGKAVLKAPA